MTTLTAFVAARDPILAAQLDEAAKRAGVGPEVVEQFLAAVNEAVNKLDRATGLKPRA